MCTAVVGHGVALEVQLHHRQQAGGHWTVNGVNRCWVVALVSAAQYLLIQHWNIYLHKPSIYYQRLHFSIFYLQKKQKDLEWNP